MNSLDTSHCRINSYTYDKLGNRLTETPPTPCAAPAFDGLGAITGFTYNQAGRLASRVAGAQTLAQYTYNAFGQRAVKTQPGSATTARYAYGPGGRLLEESSSQGSAASADYIYLDDGRPIASFTPSAVGALYFLHVDRQSAPQLTTDFGLSSRWQGDYHPFGQIGNNNAGSPVQSLRYPGQQADAETGLYHNGARDYIPNLGRYLQSDPIGLAGGLNTYAYAGANPMTFVDPSGTTYFRTAEDNAGCAEGDDLCLFAGDDRFSLEDRAALTCTPNLDPLSSWFAERALEASDALVTAMVNKVNQARSGGSDLAAAALAAYQTGSEPGIRRIIGRRAQELTIEWLREPDRDKAAALLRAVDALVSIIRAGVMDDRRVEEEKRRKEEAQTAQWWRDIDFQCRDIEKGVVCLDYLQIDIDRREGWQREYKDREIKLWHEKLEAYLRSQGR